MKVMEASGYSVYILTLPGAAPHPDNALEMNIELSSPRDSLWCPYTLGLASDIGGI